MPVQLDGSRHAWLEDQGPKFVLLLAVDDAPGTRVETEIGAYVIAAVWRRPRHARGNPPVIVQSQYPAPGRPRHARGNPPVIVQSQYPAPGRPRHARGNPPLGDGALEAGGTPPARAGKPTTR